MREIRSKLPRITYSPTFLPCALSKVAIVARAQAGDPLFPATSLERKCLKSSGDLVDHGAGGAPEQLTLALSQPKQFRTSHFVFVLPSHLTLSQPRAKWKATLEASGFNVQDFRATGSSQRLWEKRANFQFRAPATVAVHFVFGPPPRTYGAAGKMEGDARGSRV